MSNLTDPARPLTRRRSHHLARLVVAAGVLAASLAVGSAASAKTPDDPGKGLPGAPLPFEPIVVDDIKLPSIPRTPSIPLPCFGWWCDTPLVPLSLPDYATSFDNISSSNSYYQGIRAVPYYVTIRNVGSSNPGAVWSTFASPDGEILGIEPVGSYRTDIAAAPAADTARWSAPFAISYLDDAWIVQDTDGIPPGFGYNDKVYVRVWMAGWDRPELIVSANEHVGVDYLGALTPASYQHDEVTRSNNKISFHL
jgi:hypothetical protein